MEDGTAFIHGRALDRLYPGGADGGRQAAVRPQPRGRAGQRGGAGPSGPGCPPVFGPGGQGHVRRLFGKDLTGLRHRDRRPLPGPGPRHHPGLRAAQRPGGPGLQLLPEPRADTRLAFEGVDLSLIDQCSLLCFGSLLLTAEPSRSAVEQLVAYAKEQGKITAYDPNCVPPCGRAGRTRGCGG